MSFPIMHMTIWNYKLELFYNPTRVLVESWLFYIQYFPYFVSFRCMLELVWRVMGWTSSILYWIMEGQTHYLACQEVLNWVWPLKNQYRRLLYFYFLFQTPHRLQACTKQLLNTNFFVCKMANSQWEPWLTIAISPKHNHILFVLWH